TDLDIAQPDLHQRIHLFANTRDCAEKLLRIFNRHIKYVGYTLVLELDFQCLAIIALALAGLTGDINIRQEMHLDLDQPVALTGLAPAPLDVEAETTGFIPARLRLGQPGKPVADRGKGTGIGGRVRPGRAANRALVNVDHLVQMLESPDRLAGCRRLARA